MIRQGRAVPVALSAAGVLVRPETAPAGGPYRCPGCGAAVTLRRGERRRPYFAHQRGEGCSQESRIHRAAKLEIVRVIEEWKRGEGPRPCIARSCPRYDCDGGAVQHVPEDVTHAAAEVRLDSGLVADVALYKGEDVAAVVEILATSAVGLEKARKLTVPWMEVRAEDVLERPYWWVAVQDGLQPFACRSCAEREYAGRAELEAIRGRALSVAERAGMDLPPSPPYYAAAHRCWRCGAEMLVYSWPLSGSRSARRPPEPAPATVQYVATEGAGDYWANCCPHCSAVQGDQHLTRGNADFCKVREVADR